ncbi:hypothetical protein [Saccharothrix sp. ALI-22-I]|uniref:hypothetical protein n=1 Tax=Saccharothrix sp. ALI-22-I TaxID=1933778 RepID=UPI0015C2D7FA|nr:hypothetical protein [Saccharothrix sp. ALI-22-I]
MATLWRDNGLGSHRQGPFALGKDPEFADKVADGAGGIRLPPLTLGTLRWWT